MLSGDQNQSGGDIMDERYTLDLLCIGEGAVIRGNGHVGGMRRRLFDMGFTEGTHVLCVGVSPCGDMKAYRVRGSVVALRLTDACRITVKGCSGGRDARA